MNKLLSLGWGNFPVLRISQLIPFRDERGTEKLKIGSHFGVAINSIGYVLRSIHREC